MSTRSWDSALRVIQLAIHLRSTPSFVCKAEIIVTASDNTAAMVVFDTADDKSGLNFASTAAVELKATMSIVEPWLPKLHHLCPLKLSAKARLISCSM
jgi:hypothetical protein